MTRLALVSDIHANLEAARAVFDDIDRQRPDRVVSLGDNIGYGPDPAGVLRLLKARNVPSLLGNHEWAASDPARAARFSRPARESLRWTIAALPPELAAGLAGLPVSMSLCGCRLAHGLPPGNFLTYLHGAGTKALRRAFAGTPERLSFVGHSHVVEAVELAGPSFRRFAPPPGRHLLPAGRRLIVCVGSVGWPRGGDGRAEYVIYDSAEHSLTVRAVPYDIGAVAEKLARRGLAPPAIGPLGTGR